MHTIVITKQNNKRINHIFYSTSHRIEGEAGNMHMHLSEKDKQTKCHRHLSFVNNYLLHQITFPMLTIKICITDNDI